MSPTLKWAKLNKLVFPYYNENAHRRDHVLRVMRNSLMIMKSDHPHLMVTNEPNVMMVAAAMHDICRINEKVDHAVEGANLSKDILENNFRNIFIDSEIETITTAILTHRYSKGLKAKSLIGEILQDADRLDAIGPLGISRCFEYSIKNRIPIDVVPNSTRDQPTAFKHLESKCAKLLPKTFNTTTGSQIASKYSDFVGNFIALYRSQTTIDSNFEGFIS